MTDYPQQSAVGENIAIADLGSIAIVNNTIGFKSEEVATLLSSFPREKTTKKASSSTETDCEADELLVAQSNNRVERCRLPSRIDTEEKTDRAGDGKRSGGPCHGHFGW
jgi:hypothetical protein